MAEPTNITNNIANSTIGYSAWDSTGIAIVLTISGKTFTNDDLPHYFCKVGNTAAINPMLWQSGASIRFVKSGSFAQNVAILLYDDLTPAQTITVNSTTANATITGIPQSVYADTVLNLTAAANTGCKFKLTPRVTFTDGNGTPQSIDFVLNAQNNNATLTLNLGNYNMQNVAVINITATAGFVITVTRNLTNCVIQSGLPSNRDYFSDDTLTPVLAANTGYQFTATPRLYVLDSNAETIASLNFTVAANNLTASITADLSQYLDVAGVEIYAVATETPTPPQTITVNTNTANAAVSGIPQTVYADSVLNLTATANNGYIFNTVPKLSFTDGAGILRELNFTLATGNLSATLTVDLSEYNLQNVSTITVTATAAAIPEPETITVTTIATNCTITGIPQNVYADTVLNLTAAANTGYTFETTPYMQFVDGQGNPQILNFTLAANNLTATLTADLGDYDLTGVDSITITATAAAVVPYVDKYGTINVYKVTPANLADFAEVRFFKEKYNASDTSGYFEMIDLGNYVHSVKRLYCPITETAAEVLKCGNYNTLIAVLTPLNDNVTVECGTVTIPAKNLDNVDFNSEITVFLPFIGNVNLPADYVGKTITLNYICNIITGNAIAQLICNGIIINSYECNLSTDIIYKTSQKIETIKTAGTIDFNMQILKGLQPYAVLKYYNSENKKSYNADCLRGVLSTYLGYLQITELTNFNNSTITDNERALLETKLENGVIILQQAG